MRGPAMPPARISALLLSALLVRGLSVDDPYAQSWSAEGRPLRAVRAVCSILA